MSLSSTIPEPKQTPCSMDAALTSPSESPGKRKISLLNTRVPFGLSLVVIFVLVISFVPQFRYAFLRFIRHPALLSTKWESSLRRAVADADSLIVISGSGRQIPGYQPTEIVDPNVMAELLDSVSIDDRETEPNTRCMCIGEFEFQFRRGDKVLARLDWIDDRLLKWIKGSWSGDAAVTSKSSTAIATWLSQHVTSKTDAPVTSGS